MVGTAELLHFRLGILDPSRPLVAVSQSGESAEIVVLVERLHDLAPRPPRRRHERTGQHSPGRPTRRSTPGRDPRWDLPPARSRRPRRPGRDRTASRLGVGRLDRRRADRRRRGGRGHDRTAPRTSWARRRALRGVRVPRPVRGPRPGPARAAAEMAALDGRRRPVCRSRPSMPRSSVTARSSWPGRGWPPSCSPPSARPKPLIGGSRGSCASGRLRAGDHDRADRRDVPAAPSARRGRRCSIGRSRRPPRRPGAASGPSAGIAHGRLTRHVRPRLEGDDA